MPLLRSQRVVLSGDQPHVDAVPFGVEERIHDAGIGCQAVRVGQNFALGVVDRANGDCWHFYSGRSMWPSRSPAGCSNRGRTLTSSLQTACLIAYIIRCRVLRGVCNSCIIVPGKPRYNREGFGGGFAACRFEIAEKWDHSGSPEKGA